MLLISINFGNILAVFFGIITGLIIILSIVVNNISKKLAKNIGELEEGLDNEYKNVEKIREFTDEALDEYNERSSDTNFNLVSGMGEILENLFNNIARLYDSKSKNPALNINMSQVVLVTRYYLEIFEKIIKNDKFDRITKTELIKYKNILQIVKKVKSSFIFKIYESKLVQLIFQVYLLTKKFFNPAYFIRKIVLARTIKNMKNSMAKIAISYAASDAYKIYSGKLFDQASSYFGGFGELEEEVK